MKKRKLVLAILFAVISLSCTEEGALPSPPELTLAEKLVEGSPWTYGHVEVVEILDRGRSELTNTEIENQINYYVGEDVINFNVDGTGSSNSGEPVDKNFNWEIIDGNTIKGTYEDDPTSLFLLKNTEVIDGQLIYEDHEIVFNDLDKDSLVYLIGKFFYD